MGKNIVIDFEVHPAVAKCSKCKVEVMIPPIQNLKEIMRRIEELEKQHENCEEV